MMLELSTPLRISWDIPVEPEEVRLQLNRIIESKALFVEGFLTLEGAENFAAVIRDAVRKGTRFNLILDYETLRRLLELVPTEDKWLTGITLMPPYPVGDDDIELSINFREFSWGMWSAEEGLTNFLAAIKKASQVEGTVTVLNPPSGATPLTASVRERVVRQWQGAGCPDNVTLEIHDLFLAEAFGLKPFKNYDGCAAATTLAHVDRKGNLVACRTLPLLIGGLANNSIEKLWGEPRRKALKEALSNAPDSCKDCAIVSKCKGGCPGMSHDGSFRDLSCEGQRDIDDIS